MGELTRAALFLLCATGVALAQPQQSRHIAPTEPLTPEEQLREFHLPPGFEIQLVASEPDIIKPMNLAFDHRGRLFVTHSVEYPFPAREGTRPRDTLKVLDRFGADGRAGRVATYADGLNIPMGVTPTGDGAIAFSIPRIWRFRDTDRDGDIDGRQPLYGDAGFNDTHGLLNAFTPWVDGWIYACHGFANTSTLRSADGTELTMRSGNTWRMQADGSRVEQYTFGQVNPFGLCFDPLGNLYSADCHSRPAYQLLRGSSYPTFDNKHDGLGHGPELMPNHHGSTAIAGIVYYAATQFPAQYRDTLFIGNPVTCRVNLDRLEAHGSSYRGIKQPDLVRCDDPWFRPVDLELAPDGTLYIADFYNRIIGHYEVPLTHPGRDKTRGRIWRVVYTGEGAKSPKPLPDLTREKLGKLIERLKDDNLVVRVQATNELVDRFGNRAALAVRPLLWDGSHPLQRAHGLWIVERLGGLSPARVKRLSTDADRTVRVHLLKALGERARWSTEGGVVRDMLRDKDPFVRRAAAEALGLHAHPDNLRPLLELWTRTPGEDTHLIHMARMALRNQLRDRDLAEAARALAAEEPAFGDKLANVSLGVRDARSAGYLFSWMKDRKLSPGDFTTYAHYVARYGRESSLPEIMGSARKIMDSSGPAARSALLRALQRGLLERGAQLPKDFVDAALGIVRKALDEGNPTGVREAILLAKDLRLSGVFDTVQAIALNRKSRPEVRRAAVESLASIDPKRAAEPLRQILVDESRPAPLRQRAVRSLGGLNTPESRAALLDLLKTAPRQLALFLAIGLASSREGGDILLNAVSQGKASARLLQERTIQGRLRASNTRDWQRRVKTLTASLPPENARVNGLIASRQAGFRGARRSPARGAELFKKNCAGCHQLGGQGKKVGPELDGIGNRGVSRLLEDLLDPSRNVDQTFRSSLIKTRDGSVISGLVIREEGEVLVVQETVDKETRVPKSEIDRRVLSTLSPMPSNLADTLSENDFYDLLAHLLAQRQKKE